VEGNPGPWFVQSSNALLGGAMAGPSPVRADWIRLPPGSYPLFGTDGSRRLV